MAGTGRRRSGRHGAGDGTATARQRHAAAPPPFHGRHSRGDSDGDGDTSATPPSTPARPRLSPFPFSISHLPALAHLPPERLKDLLDAELAVPVAQLLHVHTAGVLVDAAKMYPVEEFHVRGGARVVGPAVNGNVVKVLLQVLVLRGAVRRFFLARRRRGGVGRERTLCGVWIKHCQSDKKMSSARMRPAEVEMSSPFFSNASSSCRSRKLRGTEGTGGRVGGSEARAAGEASGRRRRRRRGPPARARG